MGGRREVGGWRRRGGTDRLRCEARWFSEGCRLFVCDKILRIFLEILAGW